MATLDKDSHGPRQIRVFMASPGDLAVERRVYKDTIDLLNMGFGDGAEVRFFPLGWENILATTGPRVQNVINGEIDSCDVFILVLHRRWGQEAPDSEYTSYTEEEFHRALDRYNKTKDPQIFVFFKNIDPGQIADAGPQLTKVLTFRRSLEESRRVLYQTFNDEKEFQNNLDRHLRAYAKGELPDHHKIGESIVLQKKHKEAVQQTETKTKELSDKLETSRQESKAREAKQIELERMLARQASKAANDGHLEEARQMFAQALDGTTSLEVLSLASSFYRRTGELDVAEEIIRRWLAICGEESETPETAAALGDLALIYQTRGYLDIAIKMYQKALIIEETLGLQEGMANHYGNLGLIYRDRGELDRAEDMHRRSLSINEKLDRQWGMASQYGNLGEVYIKRDDLDKAEEMLFKALEINEKLGRQESASHQYGDLAVVYLKRDDLDKAEEVVLKALAINEKFDMQVNMANQYNTLGLIYQKRDDLDKAEEMLLKALMISKKLGLIEGIGSAYGNLGIIYQEGGDLDRAEEMYRKSLAIAEKLGLPESVAINCNNLGEICKERGQIKDARRLWLKARDIFASIGMPHMVRQLQKDIDDLPPETKEDQTMSLKTEGSMTFWLRQENNNWLTNDSSYNFEPVRTDDVSVQAAKHSDGTVEIKCVGPYDQSFTFRQPIPVCDDRGMFVALTWEDRQVKLYLNGSEVESQNAT